jgi:hypothetical protein
VALHEIVEAPGADDVARHAFDQPALADRHLGLRDGTVPGHLDGRAAQEVQDADALGPAFLRDADELGERPLEPGGHHHAVGVPDGGEAVPVAGVAPHRPAFDQAADQQFVVQFSGHARGHAFSSTKSKSSV